MSLERLPADLLAVIIDLAFDQECTYFQTTTRKSALTDRQLGFVLLSKKLSPFVRKSMHRRVDIILQDKIEKERSPFDKIQRWLATRERWRYVLELKVSKRMHDDSGARFSVACGTPLYLNDKLLQPQTTSHSFSLSIASSPSSISCAC